MGRRGWRVERGREEAGIEGKVSESCEPVDGKRRHRAAKKAELRSAAFRLLTIREDLHQRQHGWRSAERERCRVELGWNVFSKRERLNLNQPSYFLVGFHSYRCHVSSLVATPATDRYYNLQLAFSPLPRALPLLLPARTAPKHKSSSRVPDGLATPDHGGDPPLPWPERFGGVAA